MILLYQKNLIEKDKCRAEGAPSEIRTCLGWLIDTRKLLIKLPSHKCKAWINDLNTFINKKSISHDDLKSLIGKLENVIIIIKMMGHFMNNMYALEIKASTSNHNIRLSQRAKEDAKIHIEFLKQAEVGISMNLLTYRMPNHIIMGDACEHGLGAFHVESGRGFTYAIPDYLQGRAHINLLEFLTQVIQIWLDFLEGRITSDSCILAIGDNTVSMRWM